MGNPQDINEMVRQQCVDAGIPVPFCDAPTTADVARAHQEAVMAPAYRYRHDARASYQIEVGPALRIDLRTEDAPPGAPTLAQAWERLFGEAGELGRMAGAALGAGFAEGAARMAEALRWVTEPDYGQVPSYARRVRPVGGRSNSRTWLAWDETTGRWRACYRTQGGAWWWR